jgi:hypothetical protein
MFRRVTGVINCRWVSCHRDMARPQVAEGREGLQTWRVAAAVLNKQSRQQTRGGPPAGGLGVKLTTPHRKREVLGRTNRPLSLIRYDPHWKRRVQQFFYCCVCIRYRGNVSAEPLPSNIRGIFTEPLSSNDKGNTQTHTRTHAQTDSNMIS